MSMWSGIIDDEEETTATDEETPPDEPAADDEPAYSFEGFEVEFSHKVVLTPPAGVPRSGTAPERTGRDG